MVGKVSAEASCQSGWAGQSREQLAGQVNSAVVRQLRLSGLACKLLGQVECRLMVRDIAVELCVSNSLQDHAEQWTRLDLAFDQIVAAE